MTLGHGIPGHDAFSDPVDALDPDGPRGALTRPLAGWGERPGTVVAIDGRALRRSFRDAAERSPLHLARAFAAESGPPPGRVRVDGRSNGTAALPAPPALLDPRGGTVTADATRARRATAESVTAKGGNCVLALKGSRETLHDGVRIHMADPENAERTLFFGDVDRDHGRTGTREATVRHDAGVPRDPRHRPGPRAVGKVTATGETRGESGAETRHFPMGGRLCPERFPKTVRSHRAGENSPRWALDVTMDGDSQRNRTDGGPGNLAPMRRLATGVAGMAPGKDAMRGKPKKAGWSDDALIGLVRAAVSLKPPQRKS